MKQSMCTHLMLTALMPTLLLTADHEQAAGQLCTPPNADTCEAHRLQDRSTASQQRAELGLRNPRSHHESLQGYTVQLGAHDYVASRAQLHWGSTHAGVRNCLQLLERQTERHRLEGVQVMHHELTTLSQHHDGCGVIVLIDGGFGGHQGPPLDRPKPGYAVGLEVAVCVTLQKRSF